MFEIEFDHPVGIHFIGIGGISMSGLAEVLLMDGFRVSGSDTNKSELTEQLARHWARIYYGQRKENITDDIDVVVYSAAVHEDNEEFAEAKRRQLPMLTRAELLGQLMRNYPTAIAVSGTHGKTTTTSMLAEVMMREDMDPTVSVGGMLDSIGGNIRVGRSEMFLTEACEYTDSFLSLFPTIGVILNVRADHLDYFKDIDHIRRSFRAFAELIPEDGILVVSNDIEKLDELTDGLHCRIITVGKEGKADYLAADIVYREGALPDFICVGPDDETARFSLAVPGEHNVMNALATIAVGRCLGIPMERIAEDLKHFGGTHRRFELKGRLGDITVIDDYAHHPDEIRATLTAANRWGAKRVVCVFQPHTYSRTKALMDDFADALSLADVIVLAKIYPAREKDNLGISSQDLADRIAAMGKEVVYIDSFDEIEDYLLGHSQSGDLILTMGAGDIVKVGNALVGKR
jgi:UDP-N-acetylmuramate--alanine ligase